MAIQQMGGDPMGAFQTGYGIGSKPNALGTAILTAMENYNTQKAGNVEMESAKELEQFKQDIKPKEWKPQTEEEFTRSKRATGSSRLSKLPPSDTGEKAGKKFGPFNIGGKKADFTPAEVELMQDLKTDADLEDLMDAFTANPGEFEKAEIDVEKILDHWRRRSTKGDILSTGFQTF